jgi:hypothetical protein
MSTIGNAAAPNIETLPAHLLKPFAPCIEDPIRR